MTTKKKTKTRSKKTARKRGADIELSAKQEHAVQVYLLYGNKAKAYRTAFGTKAKGDYLAIYAWKEFNKPHMKRRVAELQERAVYEHLVTKDILAREFDEARELALKTDAPAAAVSASCAKGKLYGHFTDKVEKTIFGPGGQSLFPTEIKIEVVRIDKPNNT